MAIGPTVHQSDGAALNDGFGAAVAVKGRYAMIGNGPVAQGPHPKANSAVYVYRMTGTTWQYVQRLSGTQSGLTPFFFEQINPVEIEIGDSFGNAIALDQEHAIVTAPLESRQVPDAVYTGAAYFFQLNRDGGAERWELTQRVESVDPQSLAFGAFSVALENQTAIISDLGWSGSAGTYQGAAHIYRRNANTWERTGTFTDPVGGPSVGFERALQSVRTAESPSAARPSWAFFFRLSSGHRQRLGRPLPQAR